MAVKFNGQVGLECGLELMDDPAAILPIQGRIGTSAEGKVVNGTNVK